MRPLNLAVAAAAANFAIPAAAAADEPFGPDSFGNLADVFVAADLDRNATLSSREYVLLRTGMIDQAWLRDYRGDADMVVLPTLVRSFSQIDRDDDGTLSRTEFTSIANDGVRARIVADSADHWDWDPEYVTVTYYLKTNPVDVDTFDDQRVVNLDGEEVGRIREIARHEDTGEYYALVDVSARVMDRTPSRYRAEVVGVPLEDLVLAEEGASLMLSHRGERYLLTEADMPSVDIEELEDVETLYAV